MATQLPISPADRSTTAETVARIDALQIEKSQAIKGIMPSISIGEIINITVRQNFRNGSGLLSFQGALVPAKLPEFLNPGDKISARVSQDAQSILFKILDIKTPTLTSTTNTSPSTVIAKQMQQLIADAQTPLLTGMKSFSIPTSISALTQDANKQTTTQAMFAGFEDTLGVAGKLGDPQIVSQHLKSAASGTLAEMLRGYANQFRALSDSNLIAEAQKVGAALRQEIIRLLTMANQDSPKASSELSTELSKLISTISKQQAESSVSKNANSKDITSILTNTLTDLQAAQQQNQEQLKILLSSVLERLDRALDPNTLKQNQQTTSDMQQLATKLEQIAMTQERLLQLNPLMTALGEPALILFPFIFQGMVAHSELVIDPNAHKDNNRNKNNKDTENEDEKQSSNSSTNNTSYQQIHMTLPMPTLGLVGVDIAHRPEEILVRITVPESDTAEFILDQLEHLAIILREQGFKKAELVANVGLPQDNAPPWCSSLRTKTSAIG